MSRATQSELLEQRIAENASSQQVDLATWIFDRVRVQPGDQVLELCCGTGGQTLAMLDRVGERGHVTALDISRSALDTLAAKAGSKGSRLTCLEASLETFPSALSEVDGPRSGFDLVFCAYGLYYSSEAARTLDDARMLLSPGGRIVVVGALRTEQQASLRSSAGQWSCHRRSGHLFKRNVHAADCRGMGLSKLRMSLGAYADESGAMDHSGSGNELLAEHDFL